MPKKNSFTFIEVMIAVAVISILSGIILVAGTPLKNKARDRKIVSDLLTIQNKAAQIYLDEKSYVKVCCDSGCDQEIINLCVDIAKYTPNGELVKLFSDARSFCAYATLSIATSGFVPSAYAGGWWAPTIEGNFFCVDNRGINTGLDLAPTTNCTGDLATPRDLRCD